MESRRFVICHQAVRQLTKAESSKKAASRSIALGLLCVKGVDWTEDTKSVKQRKVNAVGTPPQRQNLSLQLEE